MRIDEQTTRPVQVRIPEGLHTDAKVALARRKLSFQEALSDVVRDELVRLIGKGSDGKPRTNAHRRPRPRGSDATG